MDIYGDDIDSILDAHDDPLNANVHHDDGAGDYADDDGAGGGGDGGDDLEAGIKIEPKRRAVRNPQLRLNAERLIGERGVHRLEDAFKDIRFRGKGHEAADLDAVMKRIEHWAHRLYPRYNFDDFLATAEKLGRKRQVQTHMYRYRQGLLEPQARDGAEAAGDAAAGNESDTDRCEPIDEFDDLIGQQIEKYRTAPPRTPAAHRTTFDDTTFNALRGSNTTAPGTPSFVGRAPVEQSTPAYMDDFRPLPPDTPKQQPPPPQQLTAEQMARIAENRRLAQERLRLKREAAAAEKSTLSEGV